MDYRDRLPVVVMPRRRRKRNRQRGLRLLLAGTVVLTVLVLGFAAGYADLRSPGALPAAAVLAGGGVLLGVVRPGRGWLLALVAALGVPLLHVTGPALGLADQHHPASTITAVALAIAPALGGAILGAILHRIMFGSGSSVNL